MQTSFFQTTVFQAIAKAILSLPLAAVLIGAVVLTPPITFCALNQKITGGVFPLLQFEQVPLGGDKNQYLCVKHNAFALLNSVGETVNFVQDNSGEIVTYSLLAISFSLGAALFLWLLGAVFR
jgi:hypothetical protein